MSEPPPLLQPLPDPALELHLNAKPRTHSMLGTHTHEEKKYMMFEDLQWGFPKETSTMMDVKIGFQTHRADHKDANKPKASYYQKATTGTKSLAPLVTQEEVEAGGGGPNDPASTNSSAITKEPIDEWSHRYGT